MAIAPDVARTLARVPFAAYWSKYNTTTSTEWVIFRYDDATGLSFTREVRRRLGTSARIRLTGTNAIVLAAAIRGEIGQGILSVALGDSDVELRRSDANVGSIERVLHVTTSQEFEGIARVRTVLNWLDGALETAIHAKPLK